MHMYFHVTIIAWDCLSLTPTCYYRSLGLFIVAFFKNCIVYLNFNMPILSGGYLDLSVHNDSSLSSVWFLRYVCIETDNNNNRTF